MKTSDALKLALQGVKKYVDDSINTNSIIRPYEIFRVEETIFGKTGYIDVETMEPSVKYGLAEEYLDCNTIAFVIPTATTPYPIVCLAASFQVSDLMVTEKWEGDPSKGEEGLYIIVKGLNEDYKINIRHKESKNGVTVETIRNTRYLHINNTKEFIPTGDYNPATKKYVDDAIEENGFSGDYNDLENRPCYDDSEIKTFTYNGDKTDKIVVLDTAVKISDDVIASEDLKNITVTYTKSGKITEINAADVPEEEQAHVFFEYETATGSAASFMDFIFVIYNDNFELEEGILFPEKGIYVADYGGGEYVNSVTAQSQEIKQLDEKFIPDSIARMEDVNILIEENGFSGDYNDLINRPCYIANETELFRISLADLKSNIETAIANKSNYFMINMDLFPVKMDSHYYLSFNGQELLPNYKDEYPELYFYINNSDNDTIHRINISFYGKNSWVDNDWATDETKTLVEVIFTKSRINGNTVGYDDIKNEILNYYTDDIVLIEREKVTLSNYLLDKDLKIENSLSMLREGDIGVHSVSLGENCMATGPESFAIGSQNIASGASSSALGSQTKATALAAHAEGNATTAGGNSAHAEGYATTANGMSSHAEGSNTIASSMDQHVQGRFNIEDTENKYAHIVGNGIYYDKRSNCHTLDWNGNAWFQGKITLGANNAEVATKQDISDAVANATPAIITEEDINAIIADIDN